ncbi:hypothetical protein MKX01_038454 [Papaver californicum]|nr:hypothetical protein MKX01_038454 [Papaver californicum]
MAINENEFGKTICTICYEDLKPLTEYLQTITTCGHVFHQLCLQQWLRVLHCKEYDIRLFFQSIGDAIHSQKLPEKGTQEDDVQNLSWDEVKKLQRKLLGVTSSFEHQQRKLKDMSNKCKEKNKDIVFCKALLKLRTEELVKSESRCSALQQGYRRKLAAVKSALDINLQDEEVNLASYGNVNNNKYRLPIPKPGSEGGGKARTLTKRSYLKAVQDTLQDNKEKYYEIIKVVKDIEANKIETSDAKSRVKYILEGHQELITGFNIFLPISDAITLRRESVQIFWLNTMTRFESNFDWFVGLKRMHQRGSIPTTDALREIAILLRHHPDLLHEFNKLFPRHVFPIHRPANTLGYEEMMTNNRSIANVRT